MLKRILIFIIVILFFIIGCEKEEQITQKKSGYSKKIKIQEQSDYHRTFIDVKLSKKVLINSEDKKIYNPIKIIVDNEGDIYLYDLSEQKIKMINGNKIIEFGEGKGKGPKQFLNIIDFKILGDTVYIADSNLGKISIYKKRGEFIKAIKIKTMLHRIEILENNVVLLTDPRTVDNYFQLLDKNFNTINYFAERLDKKNKEERSIFLSEGALISDYKHTVFFGFTYFGVILSYDIKTDKYLVMHTIDNKPMPELKVKIGVRMFAPKGPISCYDMSLDKGIIYIVSNAGDGILEDKNPVMDVYNANTLTYKYSFRLPGKFYNLVVKNNKLYGIDKEKNILIWEIKLSFL